MRRSIGTVGCIVVTAALLAREASAKTIHVSGTGSDQADGATALTALRSIKVAASRTAPGDVVEVDDGEYDSFVIATSGTDAAWIRYRAKSGAKPKIRFLGWNGILIEAAHHIEIRGFEVVGPMGSRTLAECTADADAATPDPLCNGNGISVDSRKVDAKAHHILIAGNDVHDCPGGGISAIEGDYVTVEQNFVHGNALHTRYGASGISYLTPWNSDELTGVKMIVRGNRVFGNKTLVKWAKIQKLSDGNGIIIDTTRNGGTNPPIGAYAGRSLVENNVSVGNGGSGIHAYDSEHVDIVHNTTYQNGQVVEYAEIFANNSSDVRIMNNVMIGRALGGVNTKDSRSTATYDFNVYFAGKVNSKGSHDVVADPMVVRASLDPIVADFRLAAGSPAIDTGSAELSSPVDIDGKPRPVGASPDRGAYEWRAVASDPDGGSRDGGNSGPGVAGGAAGDKPVPSGAAGADPDRSSAPDASGGGCACSTGSAPSGIVLSAAAVVVLFVVRRRRRGHGFASRCTVPVKLVQ